MERNEFAMLTKKLMAKSKLILTVKHLRKPDMIEDCFSVVL